MPVSSSANSLSEDSNIYKTASDPEMSQQIPGQIPSESLYGNGGQEAAEYNEPVLIPSNGSSGLSDGKTNSDEPEPKRVKREFPVSGSQFSSTSNSEHVLPEISITEGDLPYLEENVWINTSEDSNAELKEITSTMSRGLTEIKEMLMTAERFEQLHQRHNQVLASFYQNNLDELRMAKMDVERQLSEAKQALEEFHQQKNNEIRTIREEYENQMDELKKSHELEILNSCRRITKLEKQKSDCQHRLNQARKEASSAKAQNEEQKQISEELEAEHRRLQANHIQLISWLQRFLPPPAATQADQDESTNSNQN